MDRKFKICIVDDEEIILKMYSSKLEKEGYEVVTYNNSRKALEDIPLQTPDLILLDILMPDLDGFKLLDELRKNKIVEKIPVIFLTNLDDDENKQKAVEKGALYFLDKISYLPNKVAELVKEILDVQLVIKTNK